MSNKLTPQKINGVSYVAARDSIYLENISPVLKVNSNYVALMPYGFIRDLKNPIIIHNSNRQWFGETAKGVEQYANVFQKKDIQIMVKPHIWVGHGQFTGNIEMNTEEKWIELEKSYESFILTYAKTATEINATIFCIGTELEKFVKNRPKFWKELIKKVRTIFKGKITYAANWDEYKRVSFWNQLDYIGIDAYFPLSQEKTPSTEVLEKGWQVHKDEIKKVQKKFQIPILFTEYGYRSMDYTGKEPWNASYNEKSINLQGQLNATQAIHNQFWHEPWFAGGFIWKWFHKHQQVGGKNNNGFTPQNKPTEKLITKLYAN